MGNAIVTGSASGIGAAVCAALRGQGHRIIGVDLREAEVETDLSTPDGRAKAVEQSVAAADGVVDRVVLCAGLGSHIEDFALIASVNYFGATEVLDGLFEPLRRGENPAVVVVCSNSARFGPFEEHPFVLACLDGDEPKAREIVAGESGFLAYAGSKHALSRAVRRRAKPWGEAGVRLNGIAPGPVETPLLQGTRDHPVYSKGLDGLDIPVGRLATPAEIAAFIAMMLGPLAAFMQGSIVYVDGGNEAAMLPDRF